jgi:hypothetical protein
MGKDENIISNTKLSTYSCERLLGGNPSVEGFPPRPPSEDFQLGRAGPLRKGARPTQLIENFWREFEGTFL